MSDSTYSYMHYFASRNSDYEYQELQGEKRICLRCMHDLEVANSVRYKNWKAEEVLSLQLSPTKINKRKTLHVSTVTVTRRRSRKDDDSEDETAPNEQWKPLNPQLVDLKSARLCLQQFENEQ